MEPLIRNATEIDLHPVSRMVEKVFDSTVASYYSKKGIRTFKGYIEPKHMEQRLKKGSRLLLHEDEEGIITGMIMTKGNDHISLFFVREELQGKGVGRSLIERLIDEIGKDHPDVERITVNSSPNSVAAYKRLGFSILEPERILHGISFTRMERIIRP